MSEDVEDAVLVVSPVVLAIGNIILVFLLGRLSMPVARKLIWLTGLFATTFAVWFLIALPYNIGLAVSSPSCSNQVGHPNCRRFEELSAVFALTLGNLNYLMVLFVLDLCIVIIGWYIRRQMRRTKLPA
ncbi:MAG: hypothetical protein M3441_26330 [Chloroflexota bacterium]|nr:hypothetical protein [Chloroflexota bacterium]